METFIKSNHGISHSATGKKVTDTATQFWQNIESSRFGIIPILLVIIGCLGGLAVAFGAHDNILKLALVAFPTIISAALVLAEAPMKPVLYTSIIAVILDLTVLLF